MVVVAMALAGCVGSAGSADSGCSEVQAPKPKKVDYEAPPQTVKVGEGLTAVVKTSCGTFEISLDTKRAPKTANSFAFLARRGFYDGLPVERIVPATLVQAGEGIRGPGYGVYELPPARLVYSKGVVAMARGSYLPYGRSGSQFFIVVAPKVELSPNYALLGKVDKGLDVVERIGELGTKAEKPRQTILIEKISIEKG